MGSQTGKLDRSRFGETSIVLLPMYSLYVDEAMDYERSPKFRPRALYPETPYEGEMPFASPTVYKGIRELLRMQGLDEDNLGTAAWNPLRGLVHEGDRVLIKPNLVMHENPSGNGLECLFTNPTLLVPIIDYVVIALRGSGIIVVADAPVQSCNYTKLIEESGIADIVAFYQALGVCIELKDLRGLTSLEEKGAIRQAVVNSDSKIVNLATRSAFSGLSRSRIESLRITNYDPRELATHHNVHDHEYCISSEALEADVIISVPKAKTHRKAGLTGALKNMVGVNSRKEYLPHHSAGSKEDGYDEYNKRSFLKRLSASLLDRRNKELIEGNARKQRGLSYAARISRGIGKILANDASAEGSWYGNDTIWRTIVDINGIVKYADRDGVVSDIPQRRTLVFCDMVIVGEGEGPLIPSPKRFGMLSFSNSFYFHDVAMARLMGSDVALLPSISQCSAIYAEGERLEDVCCVSNSESFNGKPICLLNEDLEYWVEPSEGWRDHLLRDA